MSILVDQARWGWRGTTWCHLVSDSHLDELHTFAGVLGCRRVGFQGDHYDIDVDAREIAIELGAIVCDSRELVRRLKAAGLRLRPSAFDKWQLDYRIEGGIEDEVWEGLLERHGHLRRVGEAELAEVGFHRQAMGCFVLKRNVSEAVVVHGEGSSVFAKDDPSAGLFVRTDHRGVWGVESFWPPPTSNE